MHSVTTCQQSLSLLYSRVTEWYILSGDFPFIGDLKHYIQHRDLNIYLKARDIRRHSPAGHTWYGSAYPLGAGDSFHFPGRFQRLSWQCSFIDRLIRDTLADDIPSEQCSCLGGSNDNYHHFSEECTDVEIKEIVNDTEAKVFNYIVSSAPTLQPTLLLLVTLSKSVVGDRILRGTIPPRPLEQLEESMGADASLDTIRQLKRGITHILGVFVAGGLEVAKKVHNVKYSIGASGSRNGRSRSAGKKIVRQLPGDMVKSLKRAKGTKTTPVVKPPKLLITSFFTPSSSPPLAAMGSAFARAGVG